MSDPFAYAIVDGDMVPFDSPVLITGGKCRACSVEEANGVAVSPSFRGEAAGYLAGQTARIRKNPEKEPSK